MKNTAAFYDEIYSDWPDKWADVQRDMFAAIAIKEHFSSLAAMSILDFGCGNGHTLEFIKKAYWTNAECTGVDISKIALELARWRLPDGKFYTSLPKKSEWNVIIMMGVAEHFKVPSKVLNKLGKRLTKDGLLYLEVPNMGVGEPNKFHQVNGGSGQYEWNWDRSTWEKTIDDAGFRIVKGYTGEFATWEFIWILKYKGA